MFNKKTISNNRKKGRHRSPEKKAQQFDNILEKGKQLFLERGREGFTMRRLAKRLKIDPNNLYNYVESKRELWIAIRKKFYEQFRNENREIIKKFSGSIVNLLLLISEHFFEFAEKDFAAFRMMHVIPSPPSEKVGSFEKDYKQFSFLDKTTQLIQKAIDKGEIKEKNAALLSFFLFSILLGATLVEKAMRDNQNTNEKRGKEVDERWQFGTQEFTSKEFRKYTLGKIQKVLEESNLVLDEIENKK
ncbi:MAG: TetR/AcrR family transcriptional regulator [Promethearchaeota archaeon]